METRLSVVIITYGRERVLVETLEHVLKQAPAELIVVDQTPRHEPETQAALDRWAAAGEGKILRLEKPSIPVAMNAGLLAARGEIVLFLDDDVVPGEALLERHAEAHAAEPSAAVVAGQVLQPGEMPEPLRAGESFRFNSTEPAWIADAMAGNLSVRRAAAIAAGGFDENFRGAAYLFEKEFVRRLCGGEARVFFEPRASIRHLRAPRGGTRAAGGHLTTWRPHHSVGGYYYALVTGGGAAGIFARLFRSVRTRHHLRRPWGIPVTLLAEISGLAWALRLRAGGRRLIAARSDSPGKAAR